MKRQIEMMETEYKLVDKTRVKTLQVCIVLCTTTTKIEWIILDPL